MTFVKIRRTGRLGWESSIPEGTPYSDYMLSPASDEELIKNSYRLAEDMIKVMDTPFKVRVRISPDGSRTDGKTVWGATHKAVRGRDLLHDLHGQLVVVGSNIG